MEGELDKIAKVFILLNTIKESKYRYVGIVSPKNGEKIMKIKLNLDSKRTVDFLDTFLMQDLKLYPYQKKSLIL
tara:strand:- start:218 stop:439 length:222 start_codon:yes stop_codon:yes gene_type:complete